MEGKLASSTPWSELVFQKLQRYAIGRPKQKVLNVNSYHGELALGFAKQGCDVTVLDDCEINLKYATHSATRNNLAINTLQGSLNHKDIKPSYFDVVTTQTRFPFEQLDQFLAESKRLLRSMGHIVIAHHSIVVDACELPRSIIEQLPLSETTDQLDHHNTYHNMLRKHYFSHCETIYFDSYATYDRADLVQKLDTSNTNDEVKQWLDKTAQNKTVTLPLRYSITIARSRKLDPTAHHLPHIKMQPLPQDEEPPWQLLLLADANIQHIKDTLKRGRCYIAKVDEIIIGVFVLVQTRHHNYEITNLAVAPEWQHHGLGKRLAENAVKEAKRLKAAKLSIGLGNSNIVALKIFQQLGFKLTEFNRGYFAALYPETIFENGIKRTDRLLLELDC